MEMKKKETKILAIEETVAEAFYPTPQATNRQTTEFCKTLAEEVGARICVEMLDPTKALSMHLSTSDGKYSVKNTTEADRKARYGTRANNDPSEGNFGVFSELCAMG